MAEIDELRELIIHCRVHSRYRNCGYLQMTTAQKKLYDRVWAEHKAREYGDKPPERGLLGEDLSEPHDAAACGLSAEYGCYAHIGHTDGETLRAGDGRQDPSEHRLP